VCQLERSGTRLVHRQHAAAAALRCARLAVLPATRAGLEHERGLFAAMGGSPEALLEPTARTAVGELSLRRHATTGFAQAAVDAALELAPVELPDDPTAIVVEVPASAIALAGAPAPRDAEQAWWSVPHAVMVTLLGLDLEDATLVGDARRRVARADRATTGARVECDGRWPPRRVRRGRPPERRGAGGEVAHAQPGRRAPNGAARRRGRLVRAGSCRFGVGRAAKAAQELVEDEVVVVVAAVGAHLVGDLDREWVLGAREGRQHRADVVPEAVRSTSRAVVNDDEP
jgi:hypothetical protein